MPAGAGGGGEFVRVEPDPRQLKHILDGVKAFSPKLATNLRRELRKASDDAIKDMRGVLGSGPIGNAIGRGIRTQVQSSKSRQGIRIVQTDTHPLAKAFNKAVFRHPVFGNRENWVSQSGRPYFGSVISKHRNAIQDAVQRALDDAVREIQ